MVDVWCSFLDALLEHAVCNVNYGAHDERRVGLSGGIIRRQSQRQPLGEQDLRK
jgi:hypothetical protein